MSCCGRLKYINENYDDTVPYAPGALGPIAFENCKKQYKPTEPNCIPLMDQCCSSECSRLRPGCENGCQLKHNQDPTFDYDLCLGNCEENCVAQCGGEVFSYCPEVPQPEPVNPDDENDQPKKPKKPKKPDDKPLPVPVAQSEKKFFETTGGKITIGVLVALFLLVLLLVVLKLRK